MPAMTNASFYLFANTSRKGNNFSLFQKSRQGNIVTSFLYQY